MRAISSADVRKPANSFDASSNGLYHKRGRHIWSPTMLARSDDRLAVLGHDNNRRARLTILVRVQRHRYIDAEPDAKKSANAQKKGFKICRPLSSF
jgi:hypothetical protein